MTLSRVKYSFHSSFPVYEEASPGPVTSFGGGTNLVVFGTVCESIEVGRSLYTIGRVHFWLIVRVDRKDGLTVRGGGRDLKLSSLHNANYITLIINDALAVQFLIGFISM